MPIQMPIFPDDQPVDHATACRLSFRMGEADMHAHLLGWSWSEPWDHYPLLGYSTHYYHDAAGEERGRVELAWNGEMQFFAVVASAPAFDVRNPDATPVGLAKVKDLTPKEQSDGG